MKAFKFSPTKGVLSLLIATAFLIQVYASAHGITSLLTHFKTQENQMASSNAQSIQVALLLDTSNSMDGLIEQAKSQLWNILVSLSKTHKNGTPPNLEIALYEYGNDNIAALKGHVRQVLPFTTDMDAISAALFALTTNGGNEYCAQVIDHSIKNLDWDTHSKAMRLIFIAGNENFNQGTLAYQQVCSFAKKNDIVVNTIFCGLCEEGIRILWKDGADITGGNYSCINQNEATAYIETPYDDKLSTLNTQLNDTYIAYGKMGTSKLQQQRTQDQNASGYSKANMADRARFKASANYMNASWDLVDAYKQDSAILKTSSYLPEELKGKSETEAAEYIEQIGQQRSSIQKEIKELSEQRAQYIQKERAANAKKGETDLQSTVIKAIEKQAKQKGFEIEE
ncbi:MAG: VWA domain-containing protein [Chitinophagales bacterium]|nr:VWA domain-containing protein [Chitinophagales bacterium]